MTCPKCGAQLADGSSFCTSCGSYLANNAQQTNQPNTAPNNNMNNMGSVNMGAQQVYYTSPTDHTAEFSAKDISDNKVMAMVPYLLGVFGIIIALLASRESEFTYFHVRQALKLTVVNTLLTICSFVLDCYCADCWRYLRCYYICAQDNSLLPGLLRKGKRACNYQQLRIFEIVFVDCYRMNGRLRPIAF